MVDPLSLSCRATTVISIPPSLASVAKEADLCLQPLFNGRSFGVQVDMDRLDELVAATSWGRTGVGVWEVKKKGVGA